MLCLMSFSNASSERFSSNFSASMSALFAGSASFRSRINSLADFACGGFQ